MRSAPSRKRLSAFVSVGLTLALVALTTPRAASAASLEIITFTGQRIQSIFEGLLPSRYVLEYRGGGKPRQLNPSWRGRLEGRSLWEGGAQPQASTARFLRVQDCGPTLCQIGQCFGQYDRAVPCYGCCTDPTGCPSLNNYQSDPTKNKESDQVIDEPCGADCCDDFNNCG
jgi:hypothetical protein